MNTHERRERMKLVKLDCPDLQKLTEWVLDIAESRHRAWLTHEADPLGLPAPHDLGTLHSTSEPDSEAYPLSMSEVRETIEESSLEQGGPT